MNVRSFEVHVLAQAKLFGVVALCASLVAPELVIRVSLDLVPETLETLGIEAWDRWRSFVRAETNSPGGVSR